MESQVVKVRKDLVSYVQNKFDIYIFRVSYKNEKYTDVNQP